MAVNSGNQNKKTAVKKSETIQLRVTEFQKNRMKLLADKFAGGNMTEWIVYGALNVDRRVLRPGLRLR